MYNCQVGNHHVKYQCGDRLDGDETMQKIKDRDDEEMNNMGVPTRQSALVQACQCLCFPLQPCYWLASRWSLSLLLLCHRRFQ